MSGLLFINGNCFPHFVYDQLIHVLNTLKRHSQEMCAETEHFTSALQKDGRPSNS